MDRFIVRQKRTNAESLDETGSSVPKRASIAEDQQNIETITIPKLLPKAFEQWKITNSWLQEKNNKAFCTICSTACNKKLILTFDSRSLKSKQAWVDEGFSNWKHAAHRIKGHSTSTLHINCAEALKNLSSVNVVEKISAAHLKQMMDNRIALNKIFSTVLALAKQGLPLRGDNNDQKSNFLAILNTRAEDVPELKNWLQRDGHKWTHHDIQNEILKIMATAVLEDIMGDIKNAEYYSVLLDETQDVSRCEQVSICIRIVSENLEAKEYFVGFFETPNTKSKTLFDLLIKIFEQFNLPLSKLRGQCYDGASNVSGKISGLQRRICEEEPRAVYVHCNAHNLNLVVQDSIEKVSIARKFIGTLKDLINFVRDSPKRLVQFKDIQNESQKECDVNLPSLAAYCPTRWVVRIKSLKTVRENYAQLLQFFYERSADKEIDSAVAAKASGFFEYLMSFECDFCLTMMIEMFDRIEILNTELQKSNLCITESYEKIKAVTHVLHISRNTKYETVWQKSIESANKLELDEPKITRQRKIPRRIDPGTSENHQFATPKDFFRQQFYEVFDQLLSSLQSRFENDSAHFFESLEKFALGQSEDVNNIIKFYKDDFDKERLTNDRDMYFQLLKRQNVKVKSLREIVEFMQKNEWCRGLIPEYVRYIRLLVTIPGSSCSNERSFSVLRRLKNYLRSTMLQDRLNHIAILHVYADKAENLNLNQLINKFITECSKRSSVFALSK